MAWCQALQDAQDKIGRGSASEAQLRAIIGETMARVTGRDIVVPTVREWFTQWLDSRKWTNAPATHHKYSGAIDAFLEFLGPKADGRLESVSQRDVINFRNLLYEQGKAPNTVNQFVSKVVAAPFRSAFQQGMILHNPLAGLRKLADRGRKRKQAFSIQDVRALLAVADDDWKGAILAGYTTGMRLSDVANLAWENIDLDADVIAFDQAKTQSHTIIGLHPDFRAWLETRRSKEPRAPLFRSLSGCKTSGLRGLSKRFSAIMRKAGIESEIIRERKGKGRSVYAKTFHSFRHSAASNVFTGKVVEESVKRITGHGRGQSHKHYLHVDLDAIKAASSLIPRI
jgi:integrase